MDERRDSVPIVVRERRSHNICRFHSLVSSGSGGAILKIDVSMSDAHGKAEDGEEYRSHDSTHKSIHTLLRVSGSTSHMLNVHNQGLSQ